MIRERFISLIITLGILSMYSTTSSFAQEADSSQVKNTVFPVVYYLPETSWGFGVSGLTTFRLKNEGMHTRPSQVIYAAVYTLKNQILLFAPYELYKNNGNNRIKGELGFYKYFYNFFGLGSDSKSEDLEIYDVIYPRLDVSYSKHIGSRINIGLGYKYDHFNITGVEENGILENTRPIGIDGGNKSMLYALMFYDTRDNIIFTNSGLYFETNIQKADNIFLSDFDYWRFTIDLRYFHSFKKNLVLASQLHINHSDKDTPFFDLPHVSSSIFGRGYADRRFTNYNLLTFQSELRFPIKNRFNGVVFATQSYVPDDILSPFVDDGKFTFGVGIRYEVNKTERTRLRLDIAKGGESINFYLTANEAF